MSGRATSRKRGGWILGGRGEGGGRGEDRLLRTARRDEKFPRQRCPEVCGPPATPGLCPTDPPPSRPFPTPRNSLAAPGGNGGGLGRGGPERCPLGHYFFSLIPGAAELEIAGWSCGRGRSAGLDPALGGYEGNTLFCLGTGVSAPALGVPAAAAGSVRGAATPLLPSFPRDLRRGCGGPGVRPCGEEEEGGRAGKGRPSLPLPCSFLQPKSLHL